MAALAKPAFSPVLSLHVCTGVLERRSSEEKLLASASLQLKFH